MSAHNLRRSRSIARRSVWIFFLALFCAACLQATPHNQPHTGRHAIDKLEDRWRDAMVASDVSTLEALLADDYIGITPNGTLQTKDETVRNLRSGLLHFQSLELTDRKVRFYGSTALVTSRAEVSATGPSGNFSGSFRYTRVYALMPNGSWQIVSFEASRIREGDDHR